MQLQRRTPASLSAFGKSLKAHLAAILPEDDRKLSAYCDTFVDNLVTLYSPKTALIPSATAQFCYNLRSFRRVLYYVLKCSSMDENSVQRYLENELRKDEQPSEAALRQCYSRWKRRMETRHRKDITRILSDYYLTDDPQKRSKIIRQLIEFYNLHRE